MAKAPLPSAIAAVPEAPSPRPGPLPVEKLYRRADLSGLAFETTADLPPLPGLPGQPRVRDAIGLGTSIDARGFNIFAIGQDAARIGVSMRALLAETTRRRPPSPDWIYVNNFAAPHRPRALSLRAGRGPALEAAMTEMIEELRAALPAMFEGEDYQRRRSAIESSLHGQAEASFGTLAEKATAEGVAILRTPMGFAVAPSKDGKVVPPEEFSSWPEDRQKEVRGHIERIEKELEQTLRAIPHIEKQRREAIRALDRETAKFVIDAAVEDVLKPFSDLPEVVAYVEAVRADLVENAQLFLEQPGQNAEALPPSLRAGAQLDRYAVNVLVSRDGDTEGAPVVEELHPTLANLLGRVEHLPVQGALVTNFRMIRAGSLHRANGGTIVIDAHALLTDSLSWEALKRALTRGQIIIEDVAHFVGMTTTVSLEPDPIPLDAKVVLVGDRSLYYLLAAYDPGFERHFKVVADFDDETDRTAESEALVARIIATQAQREKARPLDRGAVARMVEHAARLAGDSGRLTLLVEHLRDLVIEAGHWAGAAERAVTAREDVDRAIDEQRRRLERPQILTRDAILRGVELIDTTGERVGQVNGLTVLGLGALSFGRPTRITARVRAGGGRILDIEREVELGGPIHSKGVMILSGFLAGRYAPRGALSLQASLVFEQSYGEVEGDSASAAELLTLLSAISGLPLRQDLAITGSINQLGDIQPIGGANEKIEGFFEICAARGLTGTQGVIIPESNVQHLMLRADVVQACADGRFAIHAVRHIDQAAELLTGREAGARGADGKFPYGSVNARVEAALARFAEQRREAAHKAAEAEEE
ncbi:AAA family ATPase [Roseomonas soli]|uniref:endopeptidase La n=2 Tax=Neoroseomonas soli TaxID=1081025 RepID=A0A9X9X342_9PROT|nr:AAA family ATPase [Neoroseomonas soli]